ncbi:hypothetical protein [Amycolatopsis nigrescens]|uniref:hypothetical protein n=1 Tax=Amycolatopsis nigrescens TaxID=381445 RepID=UPI000477636A|nr:hypothetical protein [Amycolatopsis nigrescens]
MNRTAISARRVLVALAVCCATAGFAPAASAASSPSTTPAVSAVDGQGVKVHAKLDKSQVKVGEKVKLKGSLHALSPARSDGLELLLVQRLSAGVWVDVNSTNCRPNGSYSLSLSFQFSAQLTLRVFHPATTLYAAASSELVTLAVL